MKIEITNIETRETKSILLNENVTMAEVKAFCQMIKTDRLEITVYRKTFCQWMPWEIERVF